MKIPVPIAYARILDIAGALGVSNIQELPGCWEHTVGPWAIAVNGHKEEMAPTFSLTPVPPFHAYVERDGWPVAIIGPSAGACVPTIEDAMIAALTAEADRLHAAKAARS